MEVWEDDFLHGIDCTELAGRGSLENVLTAINPTVICHGQVLQLFGLIVEVVGADDGNGLLLRVGHADILVGIDNHLVRRVDIVVVALRAVETGVSSGHTFGDGWRGAVVEGQPRKECVDR